ncbi:acyl-CoA dehydrogenase domain-containing protein, partial [Polaromonas sp.]|uniref:acyl-CoA dehydrogenase domain-containing protein n=1 Tax=Polaromonas sp. TaxID=1869339 RepID=UPI0032670889
MGMLGGKLKRMELLSARLGDCLAHLYMASACFWRFTVEADSDMLPFARAALRVQLDAAEEVLRDLYANLPTPGRRLIGALVLSRTAHLAPLRDVQMLKLAALLRTRRDLLNRLCPDISVPKQGGMLDLMHALDLAQQLGEDETAALNKLVRRTRSFEEAAQGASNPTLALAYLRAADRVIQVDDFAP